MQKVHILDRIQYDGEQSMKWIEVAPLSEIADRDCKVVRLDDYDIAIYNLDGEFFAIEDCCNHDGGEISTGWVEGDVAVCPRHTAKFEIKTGKLLSGPAYEDVKTYPTRVREGIVEVRCDSDD